MKLEIELDEGIYQALQKLAPGMDIAIAIAEMIRVMILVIATHPEEYARAYEEGSEEDRKIIQEEVDKLLPRIVEKARIKDNETEAL